MKYNIVSVFIGVLLGMFFLLASGAVVTLVVLFIEAFGFWALIIGPALLSFLGLCGWLGYKYKL